MVGSVALAGSVEQTFGYSINVGGSHGWGGSESISVVGSETVVKEIPPRSGAKVTMSAQVSHENVPYEAKVRIVYEDNSHRVVTDRGIWKGVSVGKFTTQIGRTYNLSGLENPANTTNMIAQQIKNSTGTQTTKKVKIIIGPGLTF